MPSSDGTVVIDTELDSSGAEKGVKGLGKTIKDSMKQSEKSTEESTDKIKKKSEETSKSLKGLGSSFVSVSKSAGKLALKGTATAIAGTTAAITGLVTASTKAYASYEQLVGGVDTLFKESSKKVQDYANEAYKTAGMSANAYMETATSFSASLLQSLGGDTDKAADYANRAMIDMSDNANKMGTSIEMIQNAYQGFAKQNYTMLDNLKLGYGGTKEEMARLISDASKMTDIQKELNVTVDEGDMSFANIVNAISVMQSSLDIAGTTSKEAATTIEGSANMMKASWSNLLVGIADDTQDFDTLVNNFVDSATTFASNIIPRIQVALSGAGNLLTSLVPIIIEQLPSFLATILSGLSEQLVILLPQILTAIGQLISLIIQNLPTILSNMSELAMTLITMLLNGFINGIPSLLAGLTSIITTLSTDLLSEDNINTLLDLGLQLVLNLITGILNNLPLIINSGLTLIVNLAKGLIQAIPKLVKKIPQIISSLITALLDSIPLIVDAGVELLTALVDNMPLIIDTILDILPDLIDSILGSFTNSIPKLVDAGFKLFVALVTNMPKITLTIISKIPKLIASLVKSVVSYAKNFADAGWTLLTSITSKLPEITSKLVEKISKLPGKLITKIKESISDFTQVGVDLIDGLWTGIKDTFSIVIDGAGDLCNDLIDTVTGVFDIHSPSRVFRWIGEMDGKGLIDGFIDSDPLKAITSNVNNGMNKLQASLDAQSSIQLDQTISEGFINYDRLGDATALAIEKAGLKIKVDGREFGRIIRGYA